MALEIPLIVTIYKHNKLETELEANLYSQAMEHNINPMLADCAFNSTTSNETYCLSISLNSDLDKIRNTILNEDDK